MSEKYATYYTRPHGKGFYAELRAGKRNLRGAVLWSGVFNPDDQQANDPLALWESACTYCRQNGLKMALRKG